MIQHTYVGCDVSKSHVDFFDAVSSAHACVPNMPAAIAARLKRYEGQPVCVVFEATGACGDVLREQLALTGLAGCQVNPMRARRFAQSTGRLAKTDRIDAAMLAVMGERLGLEPNVRFDADLEELRALIARRDQLVAQRAAERKRLQQASLDIVRDSHREAIEGLDEHIARFDRLIADATNTPSLAPRVALLTSLPGIGAASAAVLVAHLPELGSLDPTVGRRSQSASPRSQASPRTHPRDSGNSSRPRFVHGGRSRLRRAFYMIALTASRMDGPFKQFHQRLVSHGKPKKLALVALARKIVTIANAIIRDAKAYA